MLANTETPLKIESTLYKKLILIPELVDNVQKQYENLKVSYHADNLTSQFEAQAKETKAEIDNLKKASEVLKSLLTFEKITMEDNRELFPDLTLDSINRLIFWPHNPEEQSWKASWQCPNPTSE